ncbi:MAG: hypothetical protein RIC80_13650 [Cyclobacteriaceae bacterium]
MFSLTYKLIPWSVVIEEPDHPEPEAEETLSFRNTLKKFFQEWDEIASIEDHDAAGVKFRKVLIRVGGIIMLITFSPALLLALVIAFLVAL